MKGSKTRERGAFVLVVPLNRQEQRHRGNASTFPLARPFPPLHHHYTLAMSTATLRHLLSSILLLPSSTTTSLLALPVLPTPDAVEFHLSPPSPPVQSIVNRGAGRGKRAGEELEQASASTPSTAGNFRSLSATCDKRHALIASMAVPWNGQTC